MAGTKALDRSIRILLMLSDTGRGLSVSEIAENTSIPQSTVYRLVQSLEKWGLVYRPGSGQVHIGPNLLHIANSSYAYFDRGVSRLALPVMRDLTQRTGETSFLTVVSGPHAVCIEMVRSSKAIHLSFDKGRLFPLYAGASSIIFLPYISKELREQILERSEGRKYAHGGSIVVRELRNRIKQIAEDGYVITIGEVDPDATGIAVPIFNSSYEVVAALSLAGPTERFRNNHCGELVHTVIESAQAIEEKLATDF